MEKTLRGHYQIIEHLGKGGFGETYLAADIDLPGSPRCVVKLLKPQCSDPTAMEIAKRMFEKEAETLHKLGSHPQIPMLLAHFEADAEFYLVQQFIQGESLSQELKPGRPISEMQAIAMLKDILSVLEFVHQQNVIHRDIKPANLIRRREDGKIVLIDFGAVKELSALTVDAEGQTSITVAVGTPGYMPNEQQVGKPRFCSDIYAVGAIGIQALTGMHPKHIPEDAITAELLWHDLVDRHSCSPALIKILDKMIRYDFRQRYQSVTDVLNALESVTVADRPTVTAQIPWGVSSKNTPKNLNNPIALQASKVDNGSGRSPQPKQQTTLQSKPHFASSPWVWGMFAAGVGIAGLAAVAFVSINATKPTNTTTQEIATRTTQVPVTQTNVAILPTPQASPLSTSTAITPKPETSVASPESTSPEPPTAKPGYQSQNQPQAVLPSPLPPPEFHMLMVRGTDLERSGRYTEALAVFDRTIELYPKIADVWLAKAKVLAVMGRDDEAQAAIANAIALSPEERRLDLPTPIHIRPKLPRLPR